MLEPIIHSHWPPTSPSKWIYLSDSHHNNDGVVCCVLIHASRKVLHCLLEPVLQPLTNPDPYSNSLWVWPDSQQYCVTWWHPYNNDEAIIHPSIDIFPLFYISIRYVIISNNYLLIFVKVYQNNYTRKLFNALVEISLLRILEILKTLLTLVCPTSSKCRPLTQCAHVYRFNSQVNITAPLLSFMKIHHPKS